MSACSQSRMRLAIRIDVPWLVCPYLALLINVAEFIGIASLYGVREDVGLLREDLGCVDMPSAFDVYRVMGVWPPQVEGISSMGKVCGHSLSSRGHRKKRRVLERFSGDLSVEDPSLLHVGLV